MATFWTEDGQPDMETTQSADLYAEVRRALRRLYDTVYLQRSPLAASLRAQAGEAIVPGQEAKALRKLLIETIDQLAPGGNVPFRSEERRAHAVLRGLYVEQRSMDSLADSLGLSERQLRRELHAGLEAMTDMLATHLQYTDLELPDAGLDGLMMAEIEELSLEWEPVNLSAEVRSAEALVAPLAQDRHVILHDQLGLQNVVVRANRVILRQALLALYSWAIQNHCDSEMASRIIATPSAVCFELSCVDPAHAAALAPAEHEDMVPPYLLRAMHAQIECSDDEGHRALRLRLPAMPSHSVLLIDDNQSLHHLFGRYLSGLPYSLQSAYDAPTGLALARSQQPDVIILDIMMPDQDGWELLGALQSDEETAHIPVVVCSVLEQEALAQSLAAAGYLKKPVSQSGLLSILRACGLDDLG
jgi:CheY-like chemotaxis protein